LILTEIQVVPGPTKVINPPELTVATPGLPLIHFRIFFLLKQVGKDVVI